MSGRTKLSFILPLMIFVIGFTSSADGQVVEPITVSIDKASYSEGETIIVTGEVSEILFGYTISLTVIAPNGEVILIDQLKVDRYKKFQTELVAGGSLYDEGGSGTYTVVVLYATANRTAETTFQYEESSSTKQPSNKSENSLANDKDNDRVLDSEDKCPSYSEDYNGYLDDDGCPDVPWIKPPFEKELLKGDEYIPIVYSIDFKKRPLMGISFGDNNYEQFQKVIPSVKNGVERWTSPLKEKFGGDWSVDFVIITPQTQLQSKPDFIFNIETKESNEYCSEHPAWASHPIEYDSVTKIYKAKTPINIAYCYELKTLQDVELFSWLSQKSIELTNAHEFFHALGFGHTYNKELDFMCGASPDISCPPANQVGYSVEEYATKKIITDFDLTAIAYLYGVDGFQNPNKPVFSDLKFTANDYLNFDASTYTITPVSSPEPPKEESKEESKELAIAPFVDPNQDPQYYVDRYDNEPTYAEWFDENFPEYDSIYEAVGLQNLKPKMEKTMEPKILRPLQQVALGISPQDVTCKDDFHKLYKSNGNPICVSESSTEKLIARGFIR